ncbi:MAG: hypothetical protein MUF45_01030 [Spirosomaceae bacterium]|nr:hypothetical protein [Spirosomataceae bacterium]
MKKIFFLAYLSSFVGFSQKIEIIKMSGGFKEIDLSKPKFNTKAEPIPKPNETHKMTHVMEVICDDTKESGTMVQYINITNGVVGITPELIKQWKGTGGESLENLEQLNYWAILPNMTQRMFMNTPETGKTIMEMTAGDGMYTTTMARFDAKNLGEIFWSTAKKIKTVSVPKNLLNASSGGDMSLDVYEFVGDEGKVQIWLKDLGLAEGQFAPLKQNYAVTGLGGTGWILNNRNNHVYLVFQINDAANTKGCRLSALYAKPHSFSGAGFKPMGDIIYKDITEGHQKNMENFEQNLADELEGEDDAQIKALIKEKAKLSKEIADKTMKANANAAMLNDGSEFARANIQLALDPDLIYKTNDVESRIAARRIQIELNNTDDPDRRTELNKQLNCNTKQRQLWTNYREEAKKLKEKVKGLDIYEQTEKLGALQQSYLERSQKICQ